MPRQRVHNQVLNVGATAENYRVRDLAEVVRQTVPGCEVEYADRPSVDKRNYRVDCGKIGRVLPEFQPRWNVRSGAKQLFDAFRQAVLTSEEYASAKFDRLRTLKSLLSDGRLDAQLRWTSDVDSQPAETAALEPAAKS